MSNGVEVGPAVRARAPGRARQLLVTDPAGLCVAPLRDTELTVADVAALCADVAGTVPQAPPFPEPAASRWADVRPRHPVVLLQDDSGVLAWDEAAGGYRALGLADLAVLDRLRSRSSGVDLLWSVRGSDWPVGPADVEDAVGRLAGGGWLEADPAPVAAEEPVPGAPAGGEPTSPVVAGSPDQASAPDDAATGPAVPAPPPHEPGLFQDLPASPVGAARVLAYRGAVRARRRGAQGARRAAAAGARRILWRTEPWSLRPVTPEAADGHDGADVDPVAAEGAGRPVGHADDTAPAVDDAAPAATVDAAPAVDDAAPAAAAADRPGWTDHRTPVFGVYHSPEHNANLGLGLIIAYARVAGGGALNRDFDLRRASIDPAPMLDELGRTGRRAVVLFSDYMWSLGHNLGVTRQVKDLNPATVTVHGGPHAPAYPADAERFLAEHPEVDVLVRGEGEVTIAELLAALGPAADPARLHERLQGVAGISYRHWAPDGSGYEVVRTPDRARAADVDDFPSPYLTGEFADVDPVRWRSATVESNRGCPYGCTFCDWGQATMSRIRNFDLDRVYAELEWIAARGIHEVFLADSNFGIHARDVDIARHIADLKQRYGAPQQVICSFAKNTVKHTSEIVRIWVEAGICAEGSVALQTTDPVTLKNVARSNIRVEKYDALAEEFRRHRLPIVTDLLMGLPGATVESFKGDLQRCLDQEVTPRMMETVVLPNSPMNDPAYKERFALEIEEGSNIVVASSSYTREDFEEMKRLRLLFRAFEHFGLLRHLFRWLQAERGIRALDLVHDIDRAILADPGRSPLLTWVGRYFDLVTAPPGGWPPFYQEIADLLAEQHGLAEDPGLSTVLAVQEFLMPRRGRSFPDTLRLDHDYVAWLDHHRDGGAPRPLTDFGPGELVVDDPMGVCEARILRNGFSIRREEACDNPFWVLNDWELDSPLARPMATAVPFLTNA